MAKISVSEAARLFQVSRPTLQKALKSGAITGHQSTHAGVEMWQIDVSELYRLYKPRGGKLANLPANDETHDLADIGGQPAKPATDLQAKLAVELEAMKAKVAEAEQAKAVAEARADERMNQIDVLKSELEASRQEKAALIAALPKPSQETSRSSFLARLLKFPQ